MKKITIWVIPALLLVYPLLSFAKDSGSIDKIINSIKKEQKTQQIDAEKVSDQQLENLGKALMEHYHPNPKEYKYMQEMMGGKNSTSLKSMYQMMGYRYLQGENGYYAMRGCSMGFGFRQRGSHMRGRYNDEIYNNHHPMGRDSRYGYHRMGHDSRDYYNDKMSFFHGRLLGGGILFWIFLILVIGGIFFLIQKTLKNKEASAKNSETAVEILKKRYARGEISKAEYEEIKKEL